MATTMTDLPKPSASARVRGAAWGLFAVLAFALAELGARLIFPLPEISNFNRGAYAPLAIYGPTSERTRLAHASFSWESAPDNAYFVHHLNLYGFRDRDWV